MTQLLSSAPSLLEVAKAVTRFYAGQASTLVATDNKNKWHVQRDSDGAILPGVHVVKVKSRYRFETED